MGTVAEALGVSMGITFLDSAGNVMVGCFYLLKTSGWGAFMAGTADGQRTSRHRDSIGDTGIRLKDRLEHVGMEVVELRRWITFAPVRKTGGKEHCHNIGVGSGNGKNVHCIIDGIGGEEERVGR
jgi:hypothetical protein